MKNQQTQQLLLDIAAALKVSGLWSDQAPSATAMQSRVPFCYDSMPFQQWLQFIFLPRMQALLDAGAPLPTEIAISPMAEEAFKHMGVAAQQLINLLTALDELLSGKRAKQSD